MPITINGSGTVTGISAGGLPDGTVQPADLSTGAPSWTSGGDLSFNSGYGSVATAYGCRAWVNFNGTGTVAIRASGNVSSITDNGVGNYTVNFTTAMPDANYASSVSAGRLADKNTTAVIGDQATYAGNKTVSAFRVVTQSFQNNNTDVDMCDVAIFR